MHPSPLYRHLFLFCMATKRNGDRDWPQAGRFYRSFSSCSSKCLRITVLWLWIIPEHREWIKLLHCIPLLVSEWWWGMVAATCSCITLDGKWENWAWSWNLWTCLHRLIQADVSMLWPSQVSIRWMWFYCARSVSISMDFCDYLLRSNLNITNLSARSAFQTYLKMQKYRSFYIFG